MYKLIVHGTYEKLKEFPQVWTEKRGGKNITYAEYPKLAQTFEQACEMKTELRRRGHRRVEIVTDV